MSSYKMENIEPFPLLTEFWIMHEEQNVLPQPEKNPVWLQNIVQEGKRSIRL